jgi:hypothetical protein
MWFSSKSQSRPFSRSSERRRADGSRRHRLAIRPAVAALEDRRLPSTLTVMNASDSGAGSLRAEIAAAKKNDNIVFDPSLDGQTITLTSGELSINTSLTVSGPGAAQLTISGGHATRIFAVAADNQVALSGMTISNGTAPADDRGGGIYNLGKLTVSNCTLTGNLNSQGGGGAIFNEGTLTVTDSTFSANSAFDDGAIYADWKTTLTLTDSTFSANSAFQGGGAIGSNGQSTVSDRTLSGNSAIDGGAIVAGGGSMTIDNSTLSGNTADPSRGVGGAIYSCIGTLTLRNSTLSDNSAFQGGAIYMQYSQTTATVTGCTLSDSNPSDGPLIYVAAGSLTVRNSDFHSASGRYIYGAYKDLGGNTFN